MNSNDMLGRKVSYTAYRGKGASEVVSGLVTDILVYSNAPWLKITTDLGVVDGQQKTKDTYVPVWYATGWIDSFKVR